MTLINQRHCHSQFVLKRTSKNNPPPQKKNVFAAKLAFITIAAILKPYKRLDKAYPSVYIYVLRTINSEFRQKKIMNRLSKTTRNKC